jgi:hypothetical protein
LRVGVVCSLESVPAIAIMSILSTEAPMKITEMSVSTDDGDVLVTAEDIANLATITDEELEKWLQISREDLLACWKEGEKLMEDYEPSDRVRPIAEQLNDGSREVIIVKYSEYTDQLMQDNEPTGKGH